MDALPVILVCLATFRVTRLLTADAFPPIAALRRRVEDRWGDESWQSYLASCAWCVSVYVGGAVTLGAVLLLDRGLPAPVLVWATASAVTGVLTTLVALAEE